MQLGDEVIDVIDVDTHVVEPGDLWTARVPKSLATRVPRIKFDAHSGFDVWYIDDKPVFPAWVVAHTGWGEYAPKHPRTLDEVDPVTYDAKARLGRMDHDGIYAQILYPNLTLFTSDRLQSFDDQELQLLMIQVFNDWQHEWAHEAPNRLLPMASLPFWDLPSTIKEIERCADRGFRGVIFSQNPAAFGLPPLASRHWDPMWETLQAAKLPVNFHLGSGGVDQEVFTRADGFGVHAEYAAKSVGFFMDNAKTITQLTLGGVCHRFPSLQFVSVESGVGYLPYLLEALDWQFLSTGIDKEHPEYGLLPSEYFKRQIFGCFWFERAAARAAIDLIGADRILFETDFPHPTSQTPGPATPAKMPAEYVREAFGDLPPSDLRKILHDNAAELYRIEPANA